MMIPGVMPLKGNRNPVRLVNSVVIRKSVVRMLSLRGGEQAEDKEYSRADANQA